MTPEICKSDVTSVMLFVAPHPKSAAAAACGRHSSGSRCGSHRVHSRNPDYVQESSTVVECRTRSGGLSNKIFYVQASKSSGCQCCILDYFCRLMCEIASVILCGWQRCRRRTQIVWTWSNSTLCRACRRETSRSSSLPKGMQAVFP